MRAASSTCTSSTEAPAKGLPSVPVWALGHPLQIELPLSTAALLPSPLPGARHVHRFFCGCKWSYFTAPFPVTKPFMFIKGDADGKREN